MSIYVLLQVAYLAALAGAGVVAVKYGDWPERAGVGLIVGGSILTVPASVIPGLNGPTALGILAVDAVVLVAFLYLVLKTDRFWPLWACGFHLVGVATHLATLSHPDIVPLAYKLVRGAWAYPMLAAIVLAVLNPLTATGRTGSA